MRIRFLLSVILIATLPGVLAISCGSFPVPGGADDEEQTGGLVPPAPNDQDDEDPGDVDPCPSGSDDCQSTIPAAELLEARLSTASANDGQQLQAEYRVLASGTLHARLKCRMVGSGLDVLKDLEGNGSVMLKEGDHWYSRTLQVDLPPNVDPGRIELYFEVRLDDGKLLVSPYTAFLNVTLNFPAKVPILMYHYFSPVVHDYDWVTPGNFRKQMLALKAYGYTPLFLQELLDCRAGKTPWPAKPVVITVDDGVRSVYTEMYPILAEPAVDMKATAFIISGWTGRQTGLYATMNWEQLRELQESGRFDIQSHGATHRELTLLPTEQLRAELARAHGEIEAYLNKKVAFLSYPFGETNIWVKDAAWQAGFSAAVVAPGGVEQTCDDKFALQRVPINSTVTVNYNPDQPQTFFMSLLDDPDVIIPLIEVSSIAALDPWTGQSVDTVLPGRQVKIRVQARNSGPAAKVRVSFTLGGAQGIYFDTHDENVWTNDITRTFARGTSTFEWILSLPGDIPPGPVQLRVSFHDEHRVLQWYQSQWQQVFSMP